MQKPTPPWLSESRREGFNSPPAPSKFRERSYYRDQHGSPTEFQNSFSCLRSVNQTRSTKIYPFTLLFIAVTAFKFLLFPTYRSTDFEVHRNWLAITHSLPVSKWYYEVTSEWTLDYPPLFAWLEYFLSQIALFFDTAMLKVDNLNYESPRTVFFQRLSVVILDSVYVYAVYEGSVFLSQRSPASRSQKLFSPSTIYACLMLWNVGLLIVDHIHFQYNGFLLGVLQLSIIRIVEKRYVAAAFWFSVAINLKHIFLYMAPAFGIYLFRQTCFSGTSLSTFNVKQFALLGSVFLVVTATSLGPFIVLGQLPQLLSRLFPFQRGLTHAYWAPNFWAVYNFCDKILGIVLQRLGLLTIDSVASLTGGLVQEYQHVALPSISPRLTMILTIIGMLPSLKYLWNAKTGDQFVRGLTTCTLSSFLFGWHVHEKAILLAAVPYTWLAISSSSDARWFLLLVTAGSYGMHPLLFTGAEIPLKYLMLLMYCWAAFRMLKDRFPAYSIQKYTLPLLNSLESAYVLGFIFVEFYNNIVHNSVLGLSSQLPFVPLMLTSVYAACGVIYVYFRINLSLL